MDFSLQTLLYYCELIMQKYEYKRNFKKISCCSTCCPCFLNRNFAKWILNCRISPDWKVSHVLAFWITWCERYLLGCNIFTHNDRPCLIFRDGHTTVHSVPSDGFQKKFASIGWILGPTLAFSFYIKMKKNNVRKNRKWRKSKALIHEGT